MESERGCTYSLSQFIFPYFLFREPPHGSFLLRTTELQYHEFSRSIASGRNKSQIHLHEKFPRKCILREMQDVFMYPAQNIDVLTNLDLRNTISTEGSHTSYVRGARACLLCTHLLTKINRDFHGTVNILDENSSKSYHVNAFQLQSTERFMQNKDKRLDERGYSSILLHWVVVHKIILWDPTTIRG